MVMKPGVIAPTIKHWILKSCRRCRGDMFLDGDAWCCISCGWSPSDEHSSARYRLGRKALGIDVKNIVDTLRHTKDMKSAADILHCSRGYIYQELKKRGLTPKEVIGEQAEI